MSVSTFPQRHSQRAQRTRWLHTRAVPALVLAATCATCATFAVAACETNPYDLAQEPRVTVARDAASVVVNWTPDGAHLVRVYRGATAGDGYGDRLVWSIVASGKNTLRSGIAYGASPSGGTIGVAPVPLLPGETYTVQVTRQDPEGSGDGFTNTRSRYVGTARFIRWAPGLHWMPAALTGWAT